MKSTLCVLAAALCILVTVPASSNAAPVPDHFTTGTYPLSFSVDNPCNGELIEFDGTYTSTITYISDAERGRFRYQRVQRVTATGVGSFGNKYSFHLADAQAQMYLWPSDPYFEVTSWTNTTQVGSVTAPNFVAHMTFKITTNALGESTAVFDAARTECVG